MYLENSISLSYAGEPRGSIREDPSQRRWRACQGKARERNIIYGFRLHLDITGKGQLRGIEVEDLRRTEEINSVRNIVESDHAALEDVA